MNTEKPEGPAVGCDYVQIGWLMWDGDDPLGYGDAFVVFSKDNPVQAEDIQKQRGGDHRGHIWKSEAVYKKCLAVKAHNVKPHNLWLWCHAITIK